MSASGGPAQYEIRVAGVLDGWWADWFDGLQISGQGEETVICGLVADQSALHGLHRRRGPQRAAVLIWLLTAITLITVAVIASRGGPVSCPHAWGICGR